MYDVIIIGAGPGGCITAYQLAKEKVDGKPIKILILEASKSLKRLKPCGGDSTTKLIKEIPELKNIVVGNYEDYSISYDGRKMGLLKDKKKHILFTRSCSTTGLDYYLPKLLSNKKNITIRTGQCVDSMKVGDYATVRSGDKEYHSKLVIDASGPMTNFHNKLVKTNTKTSKYVCSVTEFKLDEENKKKVLTLLGGNKHRTRVDAFSNDPVGGYWLFYYTKTNTVNVGCGFFKDEMQRDRLIKYLNYLDLKGWYPSEMSGWIVPIGIPSQLCTDRVLWIGDSVGMAAATGHGILNILNVSKPLVKTCVRALKSNDFSKENLESYQNSKEVQTIMKKAEYFNKYLPLLKFSSKLAPKWLKRYFVRKSVEKKTLNE